MIIVLRARATEEEVAQVCRRIEALGLTPHLSRGVERTIIGAIGDERILLDKGIEALPMVEKVLPVLRPYKLASRDFHPDNTVVVINGVRVGDQRLAVVAGPCSVESREMLLSVAKEVREAGAHLLRGGAFKPRTSPYAFQGLGEEALRYLAEDERETGMPIVTELMDPEAVARLEAVCSVDVKYGLSREQILAAIEAARGNRKRAAALLGISRATLYRKLGRHSI